jgi:hypothetical protein
VWAWTGVTHLTRGAIGGVLWRRWWTLSFHKMRGISYQLCNGQRLNKDFDPRGEIVRPSLYVYRRPVSIAPIINWCFKV